jgi:hypothetical protein
MRKQACRPLPDSIKLPPDWTWYLEDSRKYIKINKL